MEDNTISDDGAILDGMVSVLDEWVRSIVSVKTTKTKCGKRVSIAEIANGDANCSASCAEIARDVERWKIIKGYDQAIKAFGFDYANSLSRAELLSAAEGL